MKKILILTLLLMVMATGAFALDVAFGVGGMFNMAWTSGTMFERVNEDYDYYEYIGEIDWTLQRQGFGGFVFLGFSRFFELNLGFIYKTPKVYEESSYDYYYEDDYELIDEVYPGGTFKDKDTGLESTSALLFGLYFKYPIPLSDSFVFFPTLGVDYEFTITKESDKDIIWWDDLMIRAGLGIDIFVTEKFFVRAHALYGFGFPTTESEFDSYKYTHGLMAKIGVGWMF
jgi:hypothetical protein